MISQLQGIYFSFDNKGAASSTMFWGYTILLHEGIVGGGRLQI
jgi:hypothetical protein